MSYGEKYIVNKQHKAVIYGAATTGAIIYRIFEAAGVCVEAFVDKRADEIESYLERPVLNYSQAENLFKENEELLAVVAVKNVFEHEKIAKLLYNMGCRKIIFRPYNEIEGKGNEGDRFLNLMYDKMLSGEFPLEGYLIEGFEEGELKDSGVIEEREEEVCVNLPLSYVYTDKYTDKKVVWSDIPVLGLFTHIDLFRMFLGERAGNYEAYMEFCREAALRSGGITITKAWEDSVWKNRLDVFNHMEYAYEHDSKFFVKNAVRAEYNEKGYFNIRSGKHRICYMIAKGNRYIPLRISKKDYYLWRDTERVQKIRECLKKQRRDSLPVILENPYFYDYPCSSSAFYTEVLHKLITLICRKEYQHKEQFVYSDKEILFYNTSMMFYADAFAMMGFKVSIFVSDQNDEELCRTIIKQADIVGDELEKDYYMGIIEGMQEPVNVTLKNCVYITEDKEEKGQILACGRVAEKWVTCYANMED